MTAQIQPIKTYVLKVQRPLMTTARNPALLIYSEDGTVPIKMVPDNGILHDKLGNRRKAYFLCSNSEDGTMRIHKEIERAS